MATNALQPARKAPTSTRSQGPAGQRLPDPQAPFSTCLRALCLRLCPRRQLLSACHFLHERSITHCDLKPENVCLVSASRRIFKIIDLGSA
eukprot:6065985-Pleurochrysis_carterae.AAC.1